LSDKISNLPKSSLVPFSVILALFIIGLIAFAHRAIQPPSLKILPGLDISAYHIPQNNLMEKHKIELGHLLFFDTRLSVDDTISCASCHNPNFGFTDGKPVSTGFDGQKGKRNAPTVINRVFGKSQFWDGRVASLEEQALGPLANPIEHGFDNIDTVVERVKSMSSYTQLFNKAFYRKATAEDIGKALAAFERTILSGDSRFDKYNLGAREALTEQEIKGMKLFNGKANCSNCHSGFNFTDEEFHNIGIGVSVDNQDLGRGGVTGKAEDKGAFKTPTLRDITATAPYMHDGSIATLEEVISFYNRGGNKNDNLSPQIEPLNLSGDEQGNLVAFLKALDGEGGWRGISVPANYY